MEWNATTLQFLSQSFLHTLSPLRDFRHQAESSLASGADKQNYALCVLHLVAEPSLDEQIRQAAAINFKNHIRSRWSSIAHSEKVQIKGLIVPLMLFAPPRIQSQIGEALAIISSHDFPNLWPELLPHLVVDLGNTAESSDYASVNGILGAANSIFKKFRYEYSTDDFLLDLKYCLVNFAEPLLKIFKKTATLIDNAVSSGSGTTVTLRPLFESQRLCCRIFYSLNFQMLPEFFEDHMEEWMIEFHKYLTTGYPTLEKSGGPDGLALVDELRAAVCENINLYVERNEDEFEGYLKGFASVVWSLLGDVTQSSSRDRLAITAIEFLTKLSTSVHHGLFEEDGTILQICQSIVIPNVRLREDDEELFEMNYVEFIRRDMEGSDLDTRRRIACELVKGIAAKYKGRVKDIVSLQIRSLLSSFAENPAANWKDKDCAIYMYLVVSLAMKRAGDSSASTDSVDVENFFVSVVVPELTSQSVNEFPMLKACALKFFTVFRNQIQKSIALQLFPDLVRFLTSESNVVHSYAASCIEKLLLVKDEWGRPRYASEDIAPVLLMLMNNLFRALRFPESEENQYVMKCIMRVLGVADITQGVATPSIAALTAILSEVCRNPKNPVFNHYLFESLAILVRQACEKDAALISTFEANLFPSLETILNTDVTEFLPYAFQVLALLVEFNRPAIPQSYSPIFGTLLKPDVWNRGPNVPALVCLLRAFLQKLPHELNQGGCLRKVLDIFFKLLASSSTEEQGFYVLNTLVENLEYGIIGSCMGDIWRALVACLHRKETVKFIKSLLIFMSLFLVKHGSANLVDSMNAVRPDMFVMILEQIWIPKLKLITGHIETKLAAVASTRLLCEFPVLLDAAAATRNWEKMLDSISILLSCPEEDRVEKEPEMPDIAENAGYTAIFVNLYNAVKKEEDPLKDIRDPKEFLAASLAGLSASSPGRHPQIIVENLQAANQT